MKRRKFLQISALAGAGLSLPMTTLFGSPSGVAMLGHSEDYRKLTFDLLKDWCDGMIAEQIMNPSDPKVHGMMNCPACDEIHARSMDAVYPFLYMAKATGEEKYLDAGIAALEWAENVTRPDGSWTNELDPKSWNGITVFGAIALAEALHYHGDLLDDERRKKWMNRLSRAADFVDKKFTINFSNVNYPATAVYGFHLFGRVLGNDRYFDRSKELADQMISFFTDPNKLIFGEGKPRDKRSSKGLPVVDLGYNVEETLNSLVMYTLIKEDQELLDLLTTSLNSHLEFMLPDGGWDDSWGTRQFKWTYWGSRTSDGCAPAFAMMADRNPAFGTAAFKNTELLRKCTSERRLLYGGIHYHSHGMKPCIHHTFAHAKPLATILDHWDKLPPINTKTPLPREIADGVKHFDELDTTLFARGDWRGTLTAYDAIYHDGKCTHPTGGALSVLFHQKVGLLCVGSMAVYYLKEPYNQQPAPGEDIAFTPRIETFKEGQWYTNLFDLTATMSSSDSEGTIHTVAHTQLKNVSKEVVKETASYFWIDYQCRSDAFKITTKTDQLIQSETAFVLPILSPTGEKVEQLNPHVITIQKPEGLVRIRANVPLKIKDMPQSRSFNMVPGAEALPILAFFTEGNNQIEISMEVEA